MSTGASSTSRWMPPNWHAARAPGASRSRSSLAAMAPYSRAISARRMKAATSISSKARRRFPSPRSTSAMELPRNAFKHALKAGKPQIGLWSSLSSNYSVEVIAGAGFDWILIDLEHSPNDLESLLGQLQAAAPYGSHPVVRVPWNDMVTIKRVLDVGAQSLLVPYVSSAQEAAAAVSYMRYPPKGVRGVAGTTRATRFGRIKDYARRAQEEICLLVQVETQQALDNIEAICAVDGVDGVFIGPADLHASLGHTGEIANPKVKPLIDEAVRRIRKAGKAPGILTPNEADARHWLECGALVVAVRGDGGITPGGPERPAPKIKS